MKTIYRSLVILFFAFLGFTQNAHASHISGGNISYICVGQDSFLVTLNLFRDCAGISAPASVPMTFTSTCGGSATLTLTKQSSQEISQLCSSQLPNSTCNGGSWPGMEEHVYSGIVVLSPPCNTWTMYWSGCCRNAQITNLTNPGGSGTYLYTTMYSGVDSCNSSPTFTSLPIPYVCMNQVVNYNFGVVEPDGDSIVYFMSPAFISGTNLVTYNGTFTSNQPLPGANAVLNPFNGQLTFTATATGVYVIAVRIEEYDIATGVIKGTSIRDIQVVVQSCSNLQPVVDSPGIYNFAGTGTQIDSNTLEVCQGGTFSFDVSFSDPDAAQTLTVFHNIFQALDNTAVVTMTPGNPAVLSVSWTVPAGAPSFTSFTLTGIDDACPVVGMVSAVFNVHINPSTVTGPDQTICAGSSANLSAVGGSAFTWFAISGSPIITSGANMNFTCNPCDNPIASPAATTTYIVVSNLTTTCTNTDTVVITVAPNFNLTMPNDTIICPIDSIMLPTSTDQPTFNYTYQWTPSNTLNFDTISNPTGLPAVPTVYKVTVSEAQGCVKVGNVFVDLSPPFPAGITIVGDTVLCSGDSTQLLASLGNVAPSSCGLSTSPCVGSLSTGTIGTGTQTNTSTSYPAPYGNYYWGARHQMIFTAAELQAMGMLTGGKISSISFDVATIGALANFNNFEVKMGCTSSSDLTAGWETGLVTVLPSYSHAVTTGWNQHTFTAAYDWDGTSNLVIEICHNQASWSGGNSALSRYSTTPFTSVRYYRADNANVCGNAGTTGTSSNRPNVRFDYCAGADPAGFNYSWSPNSHINPINSDNPFVYPTTTTTYQVVVQDTFGTCSDTITQVITVVNSFDAGFIMPDTTCINGGIVTAVPLIGGGNFTGVGITNGVDGTFDPLVSNLGTFPIKYSVSSPTGGCASDSTIDITVIPIPDATFTPMELCFGADPDTLVSVLPGGVWSGTGISDTTFGIFDPAGLSAGSYPVVYKLTVPCLSLDTQIVKVIQPYSFTFTSPILSVCEGSSINLSGNYVLSSDPLQGSGPVIAAWTDANGNVSIAGMFDASNLSPNDYVVTLSVAGTDGSCGSSQTMIVRVQPVEFAAASASLAYCSSDRSAKIYINPWLFGTGVTFSQTPIAPLGGSDTLLITAFGQNGKFNASTQGPGQWEFELTYVNTFGCVGVTVDTITVLETPEKPVPTEAVYCEGDDIYLAATGSRPDSMYWYNDILLNDFNGIGNPYYWGVAPDPANGDVFVWVTQNNWVCNSLPVKYKLPIHNAPVAKYTMSFVDTTGEQKDAIPDTDSPIYGYTAMRVFFASNNVSKDSLIWFHHWEKIPFEESEVNRSNKRKVSYNYDKPNLDKEGTPINDAYINQLVVTNEFGCSDSATSIIFSQASEQFYNVFTPNGDGQNDIFYVPVFGLTDYNCAIYNRWGDKVYEWADPSEGWAGDDQPDGVYFYVVTGVTNDGNNTEYKKQGTVTLTGSGSQ